MSENELTLRQRFTTAKSSLASNTNASTQRYARSAPPFLLGIAEPNLVQHQGTGSHLGMLKPATTLQVPDGVEPLRSDCHKAE